MVYVTGDLHGDRSRIYQRKIKKLKAGDTLIVCGDFGFVWDGGVQEKKILEYLGTRRYNVCFLDGTHENFDLLETYRETIWKGGRVHRIYKNLYHMVRGQIFEIDGLKIFTFGGGESSDKEMRMETSLWKKALPLPEEMEEGAQNIDEYGCKVDVILTHEPPSLVKSSMLLRQGRADRVNKLNGYFEELNRACKFKKWIFGSMHEDRVITPVHTAVFKEMLPLSPEDLGVELLPVTQPEPEKQEAMAAAE
ncbi:MAG TPA: hypothetical protein DEQ02_08265 [Ruminococcaceae bacterium]|nr:hypothetical protein [Oscillospiraceae bacterium]